MKDNKIVLGALGLGLILSSVGAASVYASQPEGERAPRVDREEIRAAVDNQDYQTWANLLADHPKADEFVNEETFATLVEAHALQAAGDREGARELLQEAGIKRPGKFHGKNKGDGQKFAAVREAVENGDYSAWQEAMQNHPRADEVLNEETFANMLEAHELMEAGNRDAARELMKSAGLGRR